MSGKRQHLLLRGRRLKEWVAALAVLGFIAWGVEFVSHLHVSHDTQVTAHASHFCEICAAFQAGASTPVVAHSIPKLQPPLVRAVASVFSPRLQPIHFYRSRAPPHA